MSSHKKSRNQRLCIPGLESYATYAAIVRAYKIDHRDRAESECRSYADSGTLSVAIEAAATAKLLDGSKHDHQWRISNLTLRKFAGRLIAIKNKIKRANNFDELWNMVRETGGKIKGVGELAIYDTATRIGAFLRLEPKYVYLHAGTRKGAQALGFKGKQVYLRLEKLPAAFHKLTPAQCEDCLCIYKDQLAVIKREQKHL